MALTRSAIAACLAALAITACSAPAVEPSSSPPASEFAALAASALEDARASGASAAQLEAIEQAEATGEVSFEQVQAAIDATFACFEAAGIGYEEFAPVMENGIAYVSYAFEGDMDTAVADECIHVNSDYIEALYMRQPAAVAAETAQFEDAMPAILACLEELGYAVDEDISSSELREFLLPTHEEVAVESPVFDRIECATDAGLDSF